MGGKGCPGEVWNLGFGIWNFELVFATGNTNRKRETGNL
jgi:hypothetical protein